MDALLRQLGLGQSDFARELGIAESTVYRWKTGKSQPVFTVEQLKQLQRLLWRAGLDIRDLPDKFCSAPPPGNQE